MNTVRMSINGKEIAVPSGVTILEAAKQNGVYIPTLCAYEGLAPKAACGLCLVRIEGEDKEKLACAAKVKDGMAVVTDSAELFNKRRETVQEMFRQHTVDCQHCLRIGSTKADDFDPKFCESCFFCDCVRDGFCELQDKAREFKIDKLPFEIHEHDYGVDASTGCVICDMDKCVKCRRCVDVCRAQGVGILGLIKTDKGKTVGAKYSLMDDGCIRCGRCVDVCPTGALYIEEHKDEIVYTAHSYSAQTAAMLDEGVIEPLRKLYKESFSYEQVAAALMKIGIDRVYSAEPFKAAARAEAEALLDEQLGKKKLILTGSYAAKNFLRANYPQFKENFRFCDSPQKCFGDYMRENQPGVRLVNVCGNNENAGEAHDTGCVDFFVNARELYRIFLHTGGAPAKRPPCAPEEPGNCKEVKGYTELLFDDGWSVSAGPDTVSIEKDGRTYAALICRNLGQVKKAVEDMDKYDVIKING